MHDVNEIENFEKYSFLDTGSPHHVELVEGLKNFDVFNTGKKIREGAPYGKAGANVNFVEQLADDRFSIRTYERGVEDETLSCGTGATAVALAMHKIGKTNANKIKINVVGGELEIQFKATDNGYSDIYLSGPAKQVFSGTFDL
jgi:diaminopimelate epimerase